MKQRESTKCVAQCHCESWYQEGLEIQTPQIIIQIGNFKKLPEKAPYMEPAFTLMSSLNWRSEPAQLHTASFYFYPITIWRVMFSSGLLINFLYILFFFFVEPAFTSMSCLNWRSEPAQLHTASFYFYPITIWRVMWHYSIWPVVVSSQISRDIVQMVIPHIMC